MSGGRREREATWTLPTIAAEQPLFQAIVTGRPAAGHFARHLAACLAGSGLHSGFAHPANPPIIRAISAPQGRARSQPSGLWVAEGAVRKSQNCTEIKAGG